MKADEILAILDAPQGSTVLNGKVFPNAQIIRKMLLGMYARQTADEQILGSTNHNNSIGFTGADAEFLSSVAKYALGHKALPGFQYGNEIVIPEGRKLTERQTIAVAKKLKKYAKTQLAAIAQAKGGAQVSPAPVPAPAPAPAPVSVAPSREQLAPYADAASRQRIDDVPPGMYRKGDMLYFSSARRVRGNTYREYAVEANGNTAAENAFAALLEAFPTMAGVVGT